MNNLFRLNFPTRQIIDYKLSDFITIKRGIHVWIIIVLLCLIFILYYQWLPWFPWFRNYFIFEYKHGIFGLALSIPVLYSLIISWWKLPLIVWSISLIGILPLMFSYYTTSSWSILQNIVFLVIPAALVATVGLEINWRSKRLAIEVEREKERRMYMRQILQAQEAERSRIAQELHDDITQTLMVLASNTRSILSNKSIALNKEAQENLKWTRDTTLRLAEDIRRLSLDLRPSILDTMGLVPAINWLINTLTSNTKVDAELTVVGDLRKLKSEYDIILFRIAQEGINNIRKHSKATKANLKLEYLQSSVKLSMQDNGVGFKLPQSMANYSHRTGGLGLVGMQQRVMAHRGIFTIQTEVGKGTLISAELTII